MGIGPFPWSSDYQQYREELLKGYKKVSKTQLNKAHIKATLSQGWKAQSDDDWQKDNLKKPEKHRYRNANGRYYYDVDDALGDTVAFHSRESTEEIERYIDSAHWTYDTKTQRPNNVGHIARLQYDPRRQLMRVTFTKSGTQGNVCIFFRVPTGVFGTLYWEFIQGGTQISPYTGEVRHVVGIDFWNIVRIRRTIHSTRYSFTYGEAERF